MERLDISNKEILRPVSTSAVILCFILILTPLVGIARADSWTVDLTSVSMNSENEGWIVGAQGTILHGDGKSWYSFDSPTSSDLWDVQILTSGESWAVGSDETILHYMPPFQWTKEDIYGLTVAPNTRTSAITLRAISMVDSNNGWIVGEWDRESTENENFSRWTAGIILRWDGTKWSVFNAFGSLPPLYDVSISNLNNGWAVGSDEYLYYGSSYGPTNQPNVYRWDGVSWSGEHLSEGLFRVSAVSTNEAWITAANNRELLHWSGASWTTVSAPTDTKGDWLGAVPIFFSSADSGWIAGSFLQSGDETAIYHWNGASWQEQATFGKAAGREFPVGLSAIDMQSENEGWAVGEKGTILSWDGSTWKVYSSSYWPAIWEEWWFWVIIAVIVVGAIGSVFLIRRRGRQKTTGDSNRAT